MNKETEGGVGMTAKEKICGIYFANHFFNFYHEAPIGEICKYIDELKNEGQNAVCLWFDMHHYSGADDVGAREMLEKMNALFSYAHSVGMKICVTLLANEYYKNAPAELRAENSTENGLYHSKLNGFYYTELCPSRHEGRRLITESKRELFGALSEQPDYIILWPYDQGGCTCEKCFPWGANGFYSLAKEEAKLAREFFPGVKIILSAWLFNAFTDGEWDAFFKRLKNDVIWFDFLMVDIFANLPNQIKNLGVPVLSFPEISMKGAVTWGGFGANPYPAAIKEKFAKVTDFVDGGFAYSEGIFDDINKAVVLALYADPKKEVREIVLDYAKRYFGCDAAKDVCELVFGLEKTLPRRLAARNGKVLPEYPSECFKELPKIVFENSDMIRDLFKKAVEIDERLSEPVKKSWRWRILYLRAVADYFLYKNGGFPSDESDRVYAELEKIYYAQGTPFFLSPITRKSVMRPDIQALN